MPIHYLSLRDVAARSGLAVNTIKGYGRKGLIPNEDATIGTHRGWLPETIDLWILERAATSGVRETAELPDVITPD